MNEKGDEMSISEIVIPVGIYSGLLLFLLTMHSENRYLSIVKNVIASFLYLFVVIVIWEGYESKEWHINEHSGYPPISLSKEAVLIEIGFTIYTFLLLLVVWMIKRRKYHESDNRERFRLDKKGKTH